MTTTRQLALFDLDGTLTTRDTMFDFVAHARGRARLAVGLVALSPWLAAHRVGLLSAERAKKLLLRWFFGGRSRGALDAMGEAYADRLEALLRPAALARLEWHRAAGHDVYVVSASVDLWLAAWARRRALNLLCTGARYEGDVFAGELATPNCSGPEKERRIRAAVELSDYAVVHAYGDSAGDLQMLELADEAWYKPFRGTDLPVANPIPSDPHPGPLPQGEGAANAEGEGAANAVTPPPGDDATASPPATTAPSP